MVYFTKCAGEQKFYTTNTKNKQVMVNQNMFYCNMYLALLVLNATDKCSSFINTFSGKKKNF